MLLRSLIPCPLLKHLCEDFLGEFCFLSLFGLYCMIEMVTDVLAFKASALTEEDTVSWRLWIVGKGAGVTTYSPPSP